MDSNVVNKKVNEELIKIQDELTALDGAVKQIESTKTVANDLIKSVKELQSKYVSHLESVTKETNKIIEASNQKADKFISDLSEKHTKQLENVSEIFEKYHKQTVNTQTKNNELINRTLSKTDSQIYQLSSSHNKQIQEVQELLTNYLDLAQSTATLNEEVQRINFPKRLGNIENAAKQLNQVQVQLRTDFGEFEKRNRRVLKNSTKAKRRATTTMIVAFITLIAVLGIGLDVALKYFPNLLDFLK